MATPQSAASYEDAYRQVCQWINELATPETREKALFELSMKREAIPGLAPMLWYSFGTIAVFLLEINKIYYAITPPTLTITQSNRVCYILDLLHCVASHQETLWDFLQADILPHLYPFFRISRNTRPFHDLKVASLRIIECLLLTEVQGVIYYLLSTEIVPDILKGIESGSENSKIYAASILEKILLPGVGLNYICQRVERISFVIETLKNALLKPHSEDLLRRAVACYVHLSNDPRSRKVLRQRLPEDFENKTFANSWRESQFAAFWLDDLMKRLHVTYNDDEHFSNIYPM